MIPPTTPKLDLEAAAMAVSKSFDAYMQTAVTYNDELRKAESDVSDLRAVLDRLQSTPSSGSPGLLQSEMEAILKQMEATPWAVSITTIRDWAKGIRDGLAALSTPPGTPAAPAALRDNSTLLCRAAHGIRNMVDTELPIHAERCLELARQLLDEAKRTDPHLPDLREVKKPRVFISAFEVAAGLAAPSPGVPDTSVGAPEWPLNDPQAMASITTGLEQSKRGEAVYLGSFAHHAGEEGEGPSARSGLREPAALRVGDRVRVLPIVREIYEAGGAVRPGVCREMAELVGKEITIEAISTPEVDAENWYWDPAWLEKVPMAQRAPEPLAKGPTSQAQAESEGRAG